MQTIVHDGMHHDFQCTTFLIENTGVGYFICNTGQAKAFLDRQAEMIVLSTTNCAPPVLSIADLFVVLMSNVSY